MEAESLKEDSRFTGGYTVFTHGSNAANGVDAIQIEFGKRSRENRRLAEDFTEAILVFTKNYLAQSK